MSEKETTRIRRSRRPRRNDEFVDMAFRAKPLEEAAVVLRRIGSEDLLAAVERKLAVEYGKFKPEWAPAQEAAEKSQRMSAKNKEKAGRKKAMYESIAETIATGKPRDLLGVTSLFYDESKRPLPYVVLGRPRSILRNGSNVEYIPPRRRADYENLTQDIKKELGVDKDSSPEAVSLTWPEKDKWLSWREEDPEFGLLQFDYNPSYYQADLIRVQRFPTIIPGFVLQRAYSEHPRLAVREVWSFAKVKEDAPATVR